MEQENRTVTEIVTDPNLEDAETLPAEPELDAVQSHVDENTFLPQPATIANALKYAPSIQQQREAAHVPEQYSVSEMVGKLIIVVDKVRQKAYLPADGSMRDGFQCLCADVQTEKPFTMWIGQVTLVKDLSLVMLPFRTTIVRKGRAYIFS
jgi:hypothetical protein